MNPPLFISLITATCAIAHYSVAFLEPPKASWPKAALLVVLLLIVSNMARWSGFDAKPLLEWVLYIAITTAVVRTLYDLKPWNNLTVGACYVAGSYLLALASRFQSESFGA